MSDLTRCVCRKGSIEVICGPMFSEKSGELIRRVHRAKIANLPIFVFSPDKGRYQGDDRVYSRTGASIETILLKGDVGKSLELTNSSLPGLIAFDEAHWLIGVDQAAVEMARRGNRVVIAGLDMDSEGSPYLSMALSMAVAETVTKLTAVSKRCACEATHTARIGDGDDCGGEWEPMCRYCWTKNNSIE